MSRVIAVVACGFTLAACSASMPSLDFLKSSPPTETVRIESEPPGADARTSQGQTCRTPCELTVQGGGGGDLSVTVALNGYQPQTVSLRPDQGETKLSPNPLYVELQAAPAPKPAKKKVAKKKRPATAAAPPAAAQPAPATTASIPSPPPPAAAEPAAAAQYPWPSR